MSDGWKELADQILAALESEGKSLWEKYGTEEKVFFTKIADDLARESTLMVAATDDLRREEHRENLRVLKSMAETEIARLQLRVTLEGRNMIPKIIGILAKFLMAAL